MAQRVAASTPNPIVAPVSRFPEQSLGATLTLAGSAIAFPRPVDPRPAPAWFYSALNWLDTSYVDANGVTQSFCPYMAGSDVDPYERLGATRLFLIVKVNDTFQLTISGDATSNAPLSGGTKYPNTDAGIAAMYVALANSAIFASVKYCYVPGRLGPDLVPQSFEPAAVYVTPSALPVGYDPATGLRSVVLGSAVAQVVPIDDFLNARNEQVYNDRPAIVPVVTALVYDVTQNNELGATTFRLPAYYTRDRISGSNYYVSKLGQSAIFSGGPGYTDSAATTLTLKSSATATFGGQTITTSTFDKGTAVAIVPLTAKADLAAVSLTYSGASPAAIFANQRIVGFYRDASWNTTLGVPIYDYGSSNASFTAVTAPLTDPVTLYDPTHPFLNGVTLRTVVSSLLSAPYLYSPDRLLSMLNAAIANQGSDGGAGLSVTTAGLAFDMHSSPSATIVDRLSVPVSVTVTTTPVLRNGVSLVARIGSNQPIHVQPNPVTVQAGLSAFVPNEALSGTGITGIEIGTPFPQQSLGAGTTFESATAGVTLNLLDRHLDTPPFAPYDLSLATAGVSFTPGVAYVLSMTGTTLTVRGSDGSSADSVPEQAPPDPNHTFVGAMVYAAQTTTVRLYPKLSVTLAAPAVGDSGVLQGATYGVRLTFGKAESQYDVADSTQTVIASNVSVANPVPTDGSKPQPGDLYFGSFVGGSTQMTLWSVPIFLTVAPSSLPGASFNGNMTLDALTSGLPSYELQITDSSLFVYSNFNVDTMAAGSASSNNVFLASAVINSSPEDRSAQAFAACKVLMGLVRTAQVGSSPAYVFIPEDDSVVIGGLRYMVSVINLAAMGFDPNKLPYPAALWPRAQYWQFANRHDPYAGVRYTGATEIDRIAQAQADSARIGLATATAQEPMHLYLDTQSEGMKIWPILAFPIQIAGQGVDRGALQAITSTILSLLAAAPPQAGRFVPGPLDAERVTLPGSLQLFNPYEAASNASVPANAAVQAATSAPAPATPAVGKTVMNLAPNAFAPSTVRGLEAHTSFDLLQTQQANAELSVAKSQVAAPPITQTRALASTGSTPSAATVGQREYYAIFGYSAFDPGTGEAYIVELVGSDLQPPDVLPDPTQNADYDPYYVRVVFLRTLTCYNMSIIVPAMVHDQYGHLARMGTTYDNLLSKTDELTLGYMYSLYDASNNFDSLTFQMYGFEREAIAESQGYLLTNLPYTLKQTASFSPLSLFSGMTHSAFSFDRALISFRPTPTPTPQPYFVCRRKNWSADCHLMQATHPQGTALYMAFGGGDIVPFRLDAPFDVDKRQPAHMYKLTYTFTDQPYLDAKTILVGNTPYVVATTQQAGGLQFVNFSINATAGTADVQMTPSQTLLFPPECYVVGAASTTLTAVSATSAANEGINDTGGFVMYDSNGNPFVNFVAVPYNNLVYLVRAVAGIQALGEISGFASVSGLLIDTYVPSSTGNLKRAQGARYQRSGMSYFGSSYTPATMVDSLDTLDFTSITGETFYAPTIFIPIPEIDATKSFVADISNFLGQQVWTFLYSEIVAEPGASVNGVSYPNGLNIDAEGKPVVSVQKLQFVYDPIAVLFTPNDLAHKYPLQPKQQILALTNAQIREGICWRSANVQPQREPPTNVCAQQILAPGPGMDRPNIVYSKNNRPVITPVNPQYQGMSVNSLISLSGVAYSIEEKAIVNDQTGSSLVSAVSSNVNMLVGVLFDYDNNDLGTLASYDATESSKGIVFLNGYLGANGYAFSSPDHFDVNDVLPSQVPWLEEVASVFGWDFALYDVDASLPQQFWTFAYDGLTGPGLPNFIPNVPPSIADPGFSNRTRSLLLSVQNSVRPQQLGLMDTYDSVVSANLHLQNGVTGSVFLNKKADRDAAAIGNPSTPPPANVYPLFGLPTKYDFFIFSRDHYWTLKGATFELVDMGYAMCLVDDSTGTGNKIAQYSVDSDGNYYELFAYALYSPKGILETNTFTLKITLGAAANLAATPAIPQTPNNVNPQDLVAAINKASSLIYAAFGPTSTGLPPAFIPIQAVGGAIQAADIVGAPGFNGYLLNVVGTNRQPVSIAQIYSGTVAYSIAGSTTIVPLNPKTGKPLPFYGSLSHGLDQQVTTSVQSLSGNFGGNGLGSLIATQFSCAFAGTAAIASVLAGDAALYTYNALTNTVMDSGGKSASVSGAQYFVDKTDPHNHVYGVVNLPKFVLNGTTFNVNLSTTLPDGKTSRYTLVVANKSYQFGPDNAHVTVDTTTFTFNPISGGSYTVTYAATDSPAGSEAPSPIPLTPFTIALGGAVKTVDVFTRPGDLGTVVLGAEGRTYAYDPVAGQVTVHQGATSTVAALQTGSTFISSSAYAYVVSFQSGGYSVNGAPMLLYAASPSGAPASYPLMTSPQMFTVGGNFYVFDQNATAAYVSVTGNGQNYPVNQYQFSLNGTIYIINSNVTPNTVIGGGNTYPTTAGNTQFEINGVQYTIALKAGSLLGATVSGQYNITQGNVVVVENYVYQIDTLNGQIVGNGTAYPLTSSGFTYTIATADASFTVTTKPNDVTVTIGGIVYLIGDTTVVGDGITYPILAYRSFSDGATVFDINLDGTVSVPPPLTLSGSSPWTRATFTDGVTYTVNDLAAFDGSAYHLISGSPPQFSAGGLTYTLRSDGVAISAGPVKTYIANTGPLNPNQFAFGSKTVFSGRSADVAAFDGQQYYAIVNNSFTAGGRTYTLSANTAVWQGNSYEIFSNLGQSPYFEVPGGPTYFVNVAVADFGSASGDIYNVFPIGSGQFTIPLVYTVTVSGGNATVNATTFGGPTPMATLTAASGSLTGGYFVDPVTKITYTCLVSEGVVEFVDSNNAIYAYPSPAGPNTFVASVVVATGVLLAVDNEGTPAIYPIANNQFKAGATTFAVNVPVAYQNATTGPYYPMVNGRFIVPRTDPLSNLAYTVRGGTVVKGFAISEDDEFSPDGKVEYTVNAVNVVKSSNQATLSGAEPNQTLKYGSLGYVLDSATFQASIQPSGVTYNTGSKQFTVPYPGQSVTYTLGSNAVSDNRHPSNNFAATIAGSTVSFADSVSGVSFSFDDSGNNPVTAIFVYVNHFFTDAIAGVTYYVDVPDNRVEAISYLPETTQYGFVAADGNLYLIHFSDVSVVFPVVSGAEVNAGVATVGADTFTLHVDAVDPASGSPAIPVDKNSFEINGNRYTIAGTPSGADYSSCRVVGETFSQPFLSANTFALTDPSVTYRLQLDANNLPSAVAADFAVKSSRDLIVVNDAVYLITYASTTSGSLLGQGQAAIAIGNSSFTLANPFDSTKAKFIFADANIYDAASVVGQFAVYAAPTFFIGSATYTLDTVNLVVTDNDKRPYPLIANPTMFSIGGANYAIDTNRTPHAIVGNNNVSPLATDVTVQSGQPVQNSTFTLGGLVYAYVEDALHNLLTVVGTKTYPIAQPALTFKLDSSLVFTLSKTPPLAGTYPGTTAPIGTITAGAGTSAAITLYLYAGTPESGNADFFTYKNVLYTLIASGGTYEAVQKSYTVYVAQPAGKQQQLAVFDLAGTTYMVTDGTTAGAASPAGINPATLWAATSPSKSETQFGVVYGFGAAPLAVTQSSSGVFQFAVTDATNGNITLYDVVYTAGANANVVKVDTPSLFPTFTQSAPFTFATSCPLVLETGGYNAFTTLVDETATPVESFSLSFRTPVASLDPNIDKLITPQGDFSVEFWHSLPLQQVFDYHAFIYAASSSAAVVYYVDIDFSDDSTIYVAINGTYMQAKATQPVFSSAWRHVALTYQQPYVMMCDGAGFEVKNGTNFDFSQDFSIVITFSVSDADPQQPWGLLYKGTGSDQTPPELLMSYRVSVQGNAVTLDLTDATGQPQTFTGAAALTPNTYYEAIIVKRTTTATLPSSASPSPDPYAPPFDLKDLGTIANSGATSTGSLPTSGSGAINIQDVGLGSDGAATTAGTFLNHLQSKPPSQSYSIDIGVRTVNTDGTYGNWNFSSTAQSVTQTNQMSLLSSGSAHVLIGAAYDDYGTPMPLGGSGGTAGFGNVRSVYLFNAAIRPDGIRTGTGSNDVIDVSSATTDQLNQAGIAGYWVSQYDPNGIVNNPLDSSAPAVPTNNYAAYLVPLAGYEYPATTLYVNGYAMNLSLLPASSIPSSFGYPGGALLLFNAGVYRMQELSLWSAPRQAYQVIDDMFGRLVSSNEPTLALYVSGSITLPAIGAPALPLNTYIDGRPITNGVTQMPLTFFPASLDLAGCPAVGRCGPLISPNLYNPPGVALTVCDTVPDLTTYSLTFNTTTPGLAGEINEAYVYVKNNVLTLYTGKKVGDLQLTWISQVQGDVQLIGYIEGAPPCPMANLTNKPATTFLEPTTVYPGATAITFTAPTAVKLDYRSGDKTTDISNWTLGGGGGLGFGIHIACAPFGFGLHIDDSGILKIQATGSYTRSWDDSNKTSDQEFTSTQKLDETNRYTLKLQGTLAPITADPFMAGLNTLTTPSATPGNPSTKTAILPNPNLGGFTASNPPGALPSKAPSDEKFGTRMFLPSPYGEAFVTSATLDVYQQTLVQTGTVYGFVSVPNTQIPRDLNIVSFRMSSKYVRPGCLDGVVGYVYNPATLPTGAQTYATSTGQMTPLYDGNFSAGEVGHDASYMRVVEAYKLKKEIDQQAYNALALYQSAYGTKGSASDPTLTPGLDFYNEYVWSSRGGAQEVKHTFSTTFDQVLVTSTVNQVVEKIPFNLKISAAAQYLEFEGMHKQTHKETVTYRYGTTASAAFDIAAAFDGIETDTQMRYACNNDAHFVMNFNSTFNPQNQSGVNLVIGSDGLVYNIVPSVTSGAGLPLSDNIDDSRDYMQPQPSYSSGNADGLSGALEPYDRPGKTKLYRTLAFFLQPNAQNNEDFWSTVVDQVWLNNSADSDAAALRSAMQHVSLPWRMLYRVTYSERFLPPVSTEAIVVPQITPVMAIPVINPPADFLYLDPGAKGPRPAHNPANDIEANVVLVAPTASGKSAGGSTLPNNVIPFDLLKTLTAPVSWGDSANTAILTKLVTSVLGNNVVTMSPRTLPGSTKVTDVMDPVSGGVLYSVYSDPNGLTVNVPVNFSVMVYADVNGNPIQYYDGKSFHSLQADYVASPDGTIAYYIQPPSTYDQSAFSLLGDYDLFGHPGDQWRYFLLSGFSSNMTSEPSVTEQGPFLSSTGATPYTGFTIATAQHAAPSVNQVAGYVLVQGVLQWPHLNTNAETFADVQVYKAMSVLDTFPIGDPGVLIEFLTAQYPDAPFSLPPPGNADIQNVFARNIISYFNAAQQALIPQ